MSEQKDTQTLNPATAQTVSSEIKKAESWLLQHEQIVLVVLFLLFGLFVLNKSLNLVSKYETHKAQEAAATLKAQVDQNAKDLEIAKTQLSQYQNYLLIATKDDNALRAKIAARDKQETIQQKADTKMTPTVLGQRWESLVGTQGVTLSGTEYTVTPEVTLATVGELEQVPVLQQDLKDEQQKEANLQTAVDKGGALIDQGKIVVSGLQLQLTDKDKQCTTEIAAVKADARKSKLKWFGIGYVLGFLSGATVHAW